MSPIRHAAGLVLTFASLASSAAPLCTDVFTNGFQTYGNEGTLEFEKHARLNNSSGAIAINEISKNHGTSCGATSCVATGGSNEDFDEPAFQTSMSADELTIRENTGSFTVTQADYETLTLEQNNTLYFSAAITTYRIGKLTVEKNNRVYFTPGDYFIEEFDVGDADNLELYVVGSGTVRIWSQNDIDFQKNSNINSDGSSSQLFMHTTEKITLDKNLQTRAFLRAEEIEIDKNNNFYGAMTAEQKIWIGDNSQVYFEPLETGSTDFGGACEQPVTTASYFVITHSGSGLFCLNETVGVEVRGNDDAVLADYAESITLDTGSGRGTWFLGAGGGVLSDTTAGDGLATYTFDEADGGSATFLLSYREGVSPIDVSAYQTSDSSIADDNSEGLLSFAPSGFTVTGSPLSNPPPGTINTGISRQVAGNSFSLYLTAYGQTPSDPICGVIEEYDGAKSLELWVDYDDPAIGSLVPLTGGNGIGSSSATATSHAVTFANGQASMPFLYRDAGRIVINLRDAAEGFTGASDPFVVKPAGFVVTRVESLSGTANPGASSPTGAGFVAAGEAFLVEVEARDSAGNRTPNFGRESAPEGVRLEPVSLVLPAGGTLGVLSNGGAMIATATPGRFAGNTIRYGEVGALTIRARLGDGSYLGEDDIVGPETGAIGRFYPASVVAGTALLTPSCGTFTYMDHNDLGVSLILTARNLQGATVRNYDESLLGASGVETVLLTAENADDGNDLSSRLGNPVGTWIAGQYVAAGNVTFSRAVGVDGPYQQLAIGVRLAGALDGLQVDSPDVDPASAGVCGGSCTARLLGITDVRYGRLRMEPAFGPETEPLSPVLAAQYFDGTRFVTNTEDSCSTYSRADATLGNYDGLPVLSVAQPVAAAVAAGLGNDLVVSAPGAGNVGTVDLTLAVPAWLEFDWAGSGDTDPVTQLIYGQYRGHDRIVYWREVR